MLDWGSKGRQTSYRNRLSLHSWRVGTDIPHCAALSLRKQVATARASALGDQALGDQVTFWETKRPASSEYSHCSCLPLALRK